VISYRDASSVSLVEAVNHLTVRSCLIDGEVVCKEFPPFLILAFSRKQSSDWQKLADIPDDSFEAMLPAEDRPTTSGVIRQASAPNVNPVSDDALWRRRGWERWQPLSRDHRSPASRASSPSSVYGGPCNIAAMVA
jgi:hypothetical protein